VSLTGKEWAALLRLIPRDAEFLDGDEEHAAALVRQQLGLEVR
jgi:hypothetical protein